jgi:hypothetical protein
MGMTHLNIVLSILRSAQFNNKLYQSFSLRSGDRPLFGSLLISIGFQIPNLNHDILFLPFITQLNVQVRCKKISLHADAGNFVLISTYT